MLGKETNLQTFNKHAKNTYILTYAYTNTHTYTLKCIKPRKASTYIALLSASAVPSEEIATLNSTQGTEILRCKCICMYVCMYIYMYVLTRPAWAHPDL